MLTLQGFSQSGNAYKVALMLNALGVPWQARQVDFFSGTTRTPEWRAEVNPMGEVPVLEDGARRLTQSGAILTWLAEQHGRFGGTDADERYDVLRWLLFDNHKFTSYFATLRFMKAFGPTAPDPTVTAFLRPRVDNAFGIVDRELAGRPYIVGSAPTIADFSLAGYVFYPEEESGYPITGRYPHIAAWMDRLRAMPGFALPYDCLPGERVAPRW